MRMRYLILKDGTRIDNCSDDTDTRKILALTSTIEEAAEVAALFTPDNSSVISVYNADDDSLVIRDIDLVLIEEKNISQRFENEFVVYVKTRKKTEIEILSEEIEELQEAILA